MECTMTIREIFKDEWIAKEAHKSKFPLWSSQGRHIRKWMPLVNPAEIPNLKTEKRRLEMTIIFQIKVNDEFIRAEYSKETCAKLPDTDYRWAWRYVGVDDLSINYKDLLKETALRAGLIKPIGKKEWNIRIQGLNPEFTDRLNRSLKPL